MVSIDGAGVNVKALTRLYKQNECARGLLDHLAGRSYNSAESTVDRLEQVLGSTGLECSRRDVVGVLKELENLGCGTFVIGRRGAASRFQWRVQMTSLGRTARGEGTDVVALSADEALPKDDEAAEPQDAVAEGSIRHSFNLRPGYSITLELPRDFTTREAARLSEFVKTLPFDSSPAI